MKKGGTQIEKDVFDTFQTEIGAFVRGGVYLQGTRPHNSFEEDCVIGFLTGLDKDIQEGKVNINFYVPKINAGSQKKIKNIARILEIEAFICGLVTRITDEYRFYQEQTIHSFEEDDNQTLVNVTLRYKRFSNY
ncbi:hypothetical protein HMPREF1551_00508 [Capnocytophaga sp. oral taxon 863 str. F0517]|uniref:hypothetical protein n=1 Tax=Capnocytophaga sp. oral taxon 863 TaxID=1227265 RepID=UPI0003985CBB|nr:hypothetical protein [Capnocytophaga sp. oral taxon 863]ERI64269.1 hypothetical protein HMPREF1551_00508 [Capnocytophaga sp. oral taxon 863 str. F0517]DAS16908.1 MAG TPA: hypothetical protein [Caudoviricetes sp.]